MANDKSLPEVHELAHQIGEFIHYWGFKRIHGKIWTMLFLADPPMDAAELVDKMKISKALVSISLRELLNYEVIIQVGRSDRGTQLYRANPDILHVILNVLRQREKKLLAQIDAAFRSLDRVDKEQKAKAHLSPTRMQLLQRLIGKAQATLDSLIELKPVDFKQWRDEFLAEEKRSP